MMCKTEADTHPELLKSAEQQQIENLLMKENAQKPITNTFNINNIINKNSTKNKVNVEQIFNVKKAI